MGVPAFYRWLSKRFRKSIIKVKEEFPHTVNGEYMPIDATQPNPNGFEIHNLYLDMNGIIHPCFHPTDVDAPKSWSEVFINVFDYVDRIFTVVRPRNLLFLAIDGVAPRAKMNQQRMRRFRTAQEKAIAKAIANGLDAAKLEFLNEIYIPEEGNSETQFDSNIITPGTQFMFELSEALRWFIQIKMNRDPAWRGLQVVLSDANMPGEGEHKVMDYLRSQRGVMQAWERRDKCKGPPPYNPNLVHCLYGMDADLIMLSLATHEPRFIILREDIFGKSIRFCPGCGSPDHGRDSCPEIAKNPSAQAQHFDKLPYGHKEWQFCCMNILRDYMDRMFGTHFNLKQTLGPRYDLERVIDDFIFLCFLAGNDFLPHIASLDIREGCIDLLLKVYLRKLPVLGGYITDRGIMNFQRLAVYMDSLKLHESKLFEMRESDRRRKLMRRRARDKKRWRENKEMKAAEKKADMFRNTAILKDFVVAKQVEEDRKIEDSKRTASMVQPDPATPEVVRKMQKTKTEESKDFDMDAFTELEILDLKNPSVPDSEVISDSFHEVDACTAKLLLRHPLKMFSEGYRERYYKYKFKFTDDDVDISVQRARMRDPAEAERIYMSCHDFTASDYKGDLAHLVTSYAEGLAWTFLYYYRGCASWTWYYPYHFAPLAEDCTLLAHIDGKRIYERFGISPINRTHVLESKTPEPSNPPLDSPVCPFHQLMSVLPLYSSHALPESFRDVMMRLPEYYPLSFRLDRNFHEQLWQAIAILPFIDFGHLIDEAKDEMILSQADKFLKLRNRYATNTLFVHQSNGLWPHVVATTALAEPKYETYAEWRKERVHGKSRKTPSAAYCSVLLKPDWHVEKPEFNSGLDETVPPSRYVNPKGQFINSIQFFKRYGAPKIPFGAPPDMELDSLQQRWMLPFEEGEYCKVFSCSMDFPDFPAGYNYSVNLLPGVHMPQPVLNQRDFDSIERRHVNTERFTLGEELAFAEDKAFQDTVPINIGDGFLLRRLVECIDSEPILRMHYDPNFNINNVRSHQPRVDRGRQVLNNIVSQKGRQRRHNPKPKPKQLQSTSFLKGFIKK
ncbi:hypothetical protein PCE1_004887 [Barthelona sp. PCE]